MFDDLITLIELVKKPDFQLSKHIPAIYHALGFSFAGAGAVASWTLEFV